MLHIKKLKPLYTNVLTTGDRYEKDDYHNGLIVAEKGSLKPYQTVIAVGSMVRCIEVGDKVMVNPKNYAVKKYDSNSVKEDMGMNSVIGYNFPWVTVDDKDGNPQECLLLTEGDISYVFEGEDVMEEAPTQLIMPRKTVITN